MYQSAGGSGMRRESLNNYLTEVYLVNYTSLRKTFLVEE